MFADVASAACGGAEYQREHGGAAPRIPTLTLMLTLAAAAVSGCGDDNGFVGVPDGGRAFVTSDPVGGRIVVDGHPTNLVTPDTITGLLGRHDLRVQLDTLGAPYRYSAQITVSEPDSIVHVSGPLLLRCASDDCLGRLARESSANRLRFATNPGGALFHRGGNGHGIVWPGTTTGNRYAFAGMPMISARPYPDTIGIGIYDTDYLAGRPLPVVVEDDGRVRLHQSTWVVPPVNALSLATIRGIQIDETVLATADVDDVVVVRLVFRNITNDPLYRQVDPNLTDDDVMFPTAYVGFALDADVGESADDYLSYDLDHDLAFIYDAAFEEPGFDREHRDRPGLIGLTMLEAPPGATVVLNGWPRRGAAGVTDWGAGTTNEGTGWGMMSGQRVYAPDHDHPRMGYMPPAPLDLRIMVSAGPFTLAPGDSAAITVAVIVAEPAAGTFTSGEVVEPGDPTDPTRPLYQIAQPLFERARAARALLAELATLR